MDQTNPKPTVQRKTLNIPATVPLSLVMLNPAMLFLPGVSIDNNFPAHDVHSRRVETKGTLRDFDTLWTPGCDSSAWEERAGKRERARES